MKRIQRRDIVSTLISFLVLGVLTLSIYFLEKEITTRRTYVILADAFGISGILSLLFFLLVYLSSLGTFSMLSYACFLLLSLFRKRKENQPKDFYEYQEKYKKKKKLPYFLLVSAAPYVIGAIVFTILAC